jgi:hypothetical protein
MEKNFVMFLRKYGQKLVIYFCMKQYENEEIIQIPTELNFKKLFKYLCFSFFSKMG